MATGFKSRARRSRRYLTIVKPSGSLHPRVQKVGPEHFGIVAVDCAKARSKWMLADFYGRILIPPSVVEHNKQGFDSAIAEIRRAMESHSLGDMLVAIERTGIYHLPIKRAFLSKDFDTRIVHPLTTKQYRLPADPGNKTDDTDLFAIHRAPPPTASASSSFHLMRFTGHSACWRVTGGVWYARTPHCAIRSLRFLMFFCRDIPVSSRECNYWIDLIRRFVFRRRGVDLRAPHGISRRRSTLR